GPPSDQAQPDAQAAQEAGGNVTDGDEVPRTEASRPPGEVQVQEDPPASRFGHRLLKETPEALYGWAEDTLAEGSLQLHLSQRNRQSRLVDAQTHFHNVGVAGRCKIQVTLGQAYAALSLNEWGD